MFLKIIAKKIHEHSDYNILFSNEPAFFSTHLSLLINILQDHELNNVKNGNLTEYSSPWLNVLYGAYYDNYYIAFYDPSLDSFWEKICEQKYGMKGFVYDEETPMLRFSKENIQHLLQFWETVKNNQPEYYIITQDDSGWIDVQAKNELDSDELKMVDEYRQYKEKLRE